MFKRAQTMLDYNNFTKFSIKQILSQSEQFYKPRKTKIIATIGPSCGNSVQKIREMIEHGMDIARISCEQTPDLSEIEKYITNIKQANQNHEHKNCAILLEIPGPILHIGKLENGQSVMLEKGQTLEIVNDFNFVGNSKKIGCTFEDLPKVMQVGELLALQEGNIIGKVLEIKEKSIVVEIKTGGQLDELKKIYFPELQLQIGDEYLSGPKQEYFNLSTLTDNDIMYLNKIVPKHNIDFVSISRVISVDDIKKVREILKAGGNSNTNLLAKIGTKRGFQNFESILEEADGIQVMRSMLGGEIQSEKIPVCQKIMINKANAAGKPIIVASQIFESMIKNPRPTRAEASDAANAILDGADALMFTSETFRGDYVIEALDYLRNICHEAELCFNYHSRFLQIGRKSSNYISGSNQKRDNSCVMAVNLSFDLNVDVIMCLTMTGTTARFLQKYKPQAQIVAVSPSEKVQRQLQLIQNVFPVKVSTFQNSEIAIETGIQKAKELGLIQKGSQIIVLDSLIKFHPECEREVKVINVK